MHGAELPVFKLVQPAVCKCMAQNCQYLNSCSLRIVNARVSLPRTLLFMLVHEFDALNKITTIVVFKAIVFFSVSLSSYFVCVCTRILYPCSCRFSQGKPEKSRGIGLRVFNCRNYWLSCAVARQCVEKIEEQVYKYSLQVYKYFPPFSVATRYWGEKKTRVSGEKIEEQVYKYFLEKTKTKQNPPRGHGKNPPRASGVGLPPVLGELPSGDVTSGRQSQPSHYSQAL